MDFVVEVDDVQLQRERQKARELRKSPWWQRCLAAGTCHYCQQPFGPAQLTMDHRIPLIRGGHTSKNNVVPCCKACNTAKRHQLPWEWKANPPTR